MRLDILYILKAIYPVFYNTDRCDYEDWCFLKRNTMRSIESFGGKYCLQLQDSNTSRHRWPNVIVCYVNFTLTSTRKVKIY